MFQTFDNIADPTVVAPRVAKLRAELKARGLTGLLIPRADEHQGEYVPPSAERLAWVSGFTGSAGVAVVLADTAALFVDGRYTLQAGHQTDTGLFEIVDLIATPPHAWLETRLKAGDRIGYDPWLHTVAGVRRLAKTAAATGAELVALDTNPLDAVWTDRPAPPKGKVALHPIELAGRDVAEKLADAGKAIAAKGAGALIVTQPDSIAWIFNIRGADIAHNPVPLAFAILPRDGRPSLFIDADKLGNVERDHLESHADVAPPAAFVAALDALGQSGAKVLIDPEWVPAKLADRVTAAGGALVEGTDPVTALKAPKNEAELAGTRAAHLRDGVAFARFLAWFDATAPKGGLDEIGVVEALEGFRRATGEMKDTSFDSISGSGPNGAIVHYRVSRATNRPVDRDSLFLIDSGAQYRDGTTDITRTLAIGTPSAEMRDRYTRVLKGHVAISMAVFPKGTTGAHLDAFARLPLWQAGLDFDHGTGHGVGAYLSVHEGPQRISKAGHVALEPGMIVSNEPGYYKTDAYGIRIENLVIVTAPAPIEGGERDMMRFETITLAPYDRRLIDVRLLTRAELTWIDAYHARVRAELTPYLDAETAAWLEAATAPLT
ncbi:aminopeptidase P family protein [Methyloraptor flagellatus]|uniref:Aminopeptidase P family protein n=1 Tax=Methyloraptor flagellatus TaxID=3162530 RepID=A0AAU7XBN8_9HYPH